MTGSSLVIIVMLIRLLGNLNTLRNERDSSSNTYRLNVCVVLMSGLSVLGWWHVLSLLLELEWLAL